ncbi:glycerophosphodiester phosphodiesterase family protein [uncultured Polaribacter sp.]|uniref:glycerophosphodiester phosphodiesterase family protein n=1 Tax=uncultured Polaribacter sp. TaxID=174711 RepID=UPI00260FE0B7|nr:glycerophosphodiester phosphodiesterase family protein [uncultured Polaribacter sp.]
MKIIINKIIKNWKTVFSISAFVAVTSIFSCSQDPEYTIPTNPPIEIDPLVIPINELYKDLDFTAIAGHRCYSRKSPENSLAAIQDALDLGIEILEADIQTTADDIPILLHDTTVDRTTNGTGIVANMNFGNLSNFRLKNNRNGAVITDENIPTLEQALLKIKGKKIYMHLEVKDKKFSQVIRVIKSTKSENQVILFADRREDYKIIDTFVGIYMNPVCRTAADFNFYISKSKVVMLNLAGSQFNGDNTLAAKNNNKLTWRGISGDSEDLELISGATLTPDLDELIQINPSIINTDFADLMIPYLKSKNKR